ncbi:hypothetical protein [Dyella sp. GSA-30]|uniref:hypothetical protein n=1 Tax=Dyella sp. GSA-30 TaxID=2994496 RepID=UPI0024901C99|nr:hypothetical protein [Dyella sp. GSA-30]
MSNEGRRTRWQVIAAGLLAPLAAPLLSAIILEAGWFLPDHERWLRAGDLALLYVWEFALTLVPTWLFGYPIFRSARRNQHASGVGMCMAGAMVGACLYTLLSILVFGQDWLSSVLLGIGMGGLKGFAVGALFSRLAGLPPISTRPEPLQDKA